MFLVFEGLDGSGKSTLMKGLQQALTKVGRDFVVTREPGGTELAEKLRQHLLSTEGEAPVPRCELLLYEAGRAQHVEKVIRPALQKKTWVLCDRFTASSVAFQVGGRGLNADEVAWLNNYATAGLVPDLTVLLDLTVEESQRRQGKREEQQGQKKDRFELEKEQFHTNVRDSFLQQAKSDPERWLVLDASIGPEELLLGLLDSLKERQWLES